MLVGRDGLCKITDFGMSNLEQISHCKTTTLCGIPFCMASEIVRNSPYVQCVDWWAVGVTIFQMITGHPPFHYDKEEDCDVNNAQYNLDKNIQNGEVDFSKHVAGCRIDCDKALDEESSTATRVQWLS